MDIKIQFIFITICLLFVFFMFYLNSDNSSIKLLDSSIELMYIENIISAEDCDYLINKSNGHFSQSNTVDDKGNSTVSKGRTSESYFVDENDEKIIQIKNKIIKYLKENINKNKNWEKSAETMQIVKYEIGQFYKPHHDFFSEEYIKIKNEPQREFTLFIYLNDFSGGETDFPNLGIKIEPKKSDALFWRNCKSNNQCFQESLHQGLPPNSGKKFGLNFWIRFDNLDQLN